MSYEKVLQGKKIAVLVESEYIPEEINYYKIGFPVLGAKVDFLAHLWGKESLTIVSDVTSREQNLESMVIDKEVAIARVEDYDAVIMAANYCSVRLREIPPMGSLGKPEDTQFAPAVKFYAAAMENKKIVKGAMCHALWILTPRPDLLKGRKVICHTVVLADIHNAGATFVPVLSELVVDNDLVTARSAANLKEYFAAIVSTIIKLQA